MAERHDYHHISSAVVTVLPGWATSVMAAIANMDGTEIPAHQDHRIVVILEGAGARELGDRLTNIAALDGVVSANLVFEHIEKEEVVET
ncbi:glutamate synthase [Nitratireductor sp. CAU 1489]|uniref:Chaperone NapD n=1 Tax=Nitratireductor arenosus TaxID=2682096 RepID=A0A844QGE7_9HYPH|nr:chaperone NapD [Nitratireductor arenosus]MVA98187.1 glutamate synthase [Nitratireductor arenosus]